MGTAGYKDRRQNTTERLGTCTTLSGKSNRDRDLADRIRRKDGSSMADLHSHYHGLAYRVIAGTVRNPSVAEELTQEVFLSVWHSIGRFEERRGALSTWIASIARNRALDYVRSAQGYMDRRSCEIRELREHVSHNYLEDQAILEDLLRCSRRAFTVLNDKQQQAIHLSYFDGKSHAEIAADMQAPLGTVKTWIRTGLNTLRNRLPNQVEAAPRFGAARS